MPPSKGLSNSFGHFRIIRELGAGGMGTVYEAQDTRLNCRVALKIPQRDDSDSVERFQREARFAQSIHHQFICPIYEIGQIEGIHYLTMPFIDGIPLDRLVGPD